MRTLATIWTEPAACRSLALCESIETVVPGTTRLIEAEAAILDTEVAVMETVKSPVGSVAGGVYVVGAPLAVSVGKTVPHGAGEHATVQVTPWCAGSPTTVAVS